MNKEQLFKKLKKLKAYKIERVGLGKSAVKHNLLSELIELCNPESGVSHQACWALEQSFLLHEQDCYPFLKEICRLYEVKINSSGMRVLGNISHIISKKFYGKKKTPLKFLITQTMRAQMVEGCFQELITTNKTANMAYATYSLYEYGKEFIWIYPELHPILTQKLDENYGNGFKSSARLILKKLEAQI